MYLLECKVIRVGWVVHFWLPKDKNFVLLGALTRPVNNPINACIIKSNINLYHVFLLNIYGYCKITGIKSRIIKKKKRTCTYLNAPTKKSPKIFPRHKGYILFENL